MIDEQERKKTERYALNVLWDAVRNFVEINPYVGLITGSVDTTDGERYEVVVKVHRTKGKEGYAK